jgi:hypothetical protein
MAQPRVDHSVSTRRENCAASEAAFWRFSSRACHANLSLRRQARHENSEGIQAIPSQRAGEIGWPSARLAAMMTPTNCAVADDCTMVSGTRRSSKALDDPVASEEYQRRHRIPAEKTEENRWP